MDTKAISILEQHGGKRWQKSNCDRFYFSPVKVANLDVEYYKTGNISHASINGQAVSNSEGCRIKESKVYFDAADEQFHLVTTSLNMKKIYFPEFVEKMKLALTEDN